MDNLSSCILIEIFLYCEFKEIMTISFTNKTMQNLVFKSRLFWLKYSSPKPSTFTTSAYYKFPVLSSLSETLYFPQSLKISDFPSLRPYFWALKNPKSIISKAIQASSEDPGQEIGCSLFYDNGKFWSSNGSESADTDEFGIYKLESKCLVYSVSFKLYRALYQGGVVYPPRRVRVLIGNSPDQYHYISDEFEVGMTEAYNTIQILPNLVEGEFVKLELLGKVMREPWSERYYTVLSFVDVIGYPTEKIGDCNLGDCIEDLIMKKDLSVVLGNEKFKKTPFLYERIEAAGLLSEALTNAANSGMNEIENYLVTANQKKLDMEFSRTFSSEICAKYFFDIGEYSIAKDQFLASRDYWGICKPLIMLGDYEILRQLNSANNLRYPRNNEILKFARELGGNYEEEAKKGLGIE